MKKTLIFIDLDGTLIHNIIDTIVFPLIAEKISGYAKKTVDEIILEFENENKRRLKLNIDPSWAMDWDDITVAIANSYGVNGIPSVAKLVEVNSKKTSVSLIDNGFDILRNLAHRNREIIVASKGLSKYQFPQLKSLGIYSLFKGYLMPDLTGYIKNDARFYAAYTNSSPNKIFISIGDHYVDDVIFPSSLGFVTVLKSSLLGLLRETNPFYRPNFLKSHPSYLNISGFDENTDVFPTAIINHLNELPYVIAQIEKNLYLQHPS